MGRPQHAAIEYLLKEVGIADKISVLEYETVKRITLERARIS